MPNAAFGANIAILFQIRAHVAEEMYKIVPIF